MTKENKEFKLSEKKLPFNECYKEEDVKEKVQNAERRLKKKARIKIGLRGYLEEIDKIFHEEFGDKLR